MDLPIVVVIRFMIVLTRLAGIMICAPLFSSTSVPASVRVFFSLILAFVLAPSLPMEMIPAHLNLGNIAGVMAMEVLFGFVLGFTAMCVFAGLQFAGQVISFQMGFSLINLIDPQSQVEMPVFSFFISFIGLLLFLMFNGHHWLLLAVSESFSVLPVGGARLSGPLLHQIIGFSASILTIGIRIAAPIIAITIITDIIVGIIGRTAPQIHLLVVGMPLKLLVGFTCLSFSFYFLPRYLEGIFLTLSRTLHSLSHAMR